MQQLQVNQTTQAQDLAQELEGQYGLFAARLGAQTFLVRSKQGHSIASITPLGSPIVGYVPLNPLSQQWEITKISNQTEDQSQEQVQRAGRG